MYNICRQLPSKKINKKPHENKKTETNIKDKINRSVVDRKIHIRYR